MNGAVKNLSLMTTIGRAQLKTCISNTNNAICIHHAAVVWTNGDSFKLHFHLYVCFYHTLMIQAFWNLSVWKPKQAKPYLGLLTPPIHQPEWPIKGQRSFGITAILYTYLACKTLFEPIKPTKPSVRMGYKGQSNFRKPGNIKTGLNIQCFHSCICMCIVRFDCYQEQIKHMTHHVSWPKAMAGSP